MKFTIKKSGIGDILCFETFIDDFNDPDWIIYPNQPMAAESFREMANFIYNLGRMKAKEEMQEMLDKII